MAGVLGMGRHETQAEIARQARDLRHEVGEIHAEAEVLAVRIDVLAEQRDLLIALRDQRAALLQDVLRLAGALSAAHIGHDAVRAEIVAAVHDGDPRLELILAHDGQALGNGSGRILHGEHALACRQHAEQQLRQLPQVVRGEHAVHIGIGLAHALDHGGLAHHAAAQEDLLTWVAAAGMHERADIAEHALLGVLADGAGIEDDEVRALRAVRQTVATVLEHAADLLGIRLVLLAAVGLHKGHRRDALRLPVFAHPSAEALLPLQSLGRDHSRFLFQKRSSSQFMRFLFSIVFYHSFRSIASGDSPEASHFRFYLAPFGKV